MQEIADNIFVIDNSLSSAECDHYIKLSESKGYESASLNSVQGKSAQLPELRNNHRVFFESNSTANYFWSQLKDTKQLTDKGTQPTGLNELFRFYRYQKGELFDWHCDGPFKRTSGETSRLTLIIYLNNNYKGGETKFKKVTIKPAIGSALIFPHKLLHQGSPVRKGTKYVMRSDIMYPS